MEPKHNVAGWFEIPVTDMERAIRFYETVFEFKLSRNQMGPLDMAWFPWVEESTGSGGSLVCHPDYYKPSSDGVLIYLTAFSGDIDHELSRVNEAGGKVVQQKTLIAEGYGYMAVFIDSEGNRVALHSRN
ncbi:MAG: VOC family protein [Bacteroidales bacterium]|jgi:hypothetical protein|nr:VOC family protein [Bacteroidales bacterium]